MNEFADLLQQHESLRASLGHAWNAFFARFGNLRPVQLAAIPPILAGRSTLVTAPTAGGKTEAIAAPICERLATLRWPGLSVLLITPTRALVNDLYARLRVPLDNMRIGLGRKTSDHPEWDDPRLQFLITTPESTESLLTFHREVLDNLQSVIIDEVHLLDSTARGDQLRLVLQRLSRYLHFRRGPGFLGLQRVAMSATVADPARLAAAFLGPKATIVSVPGQRAIEAKTITVLGDDETRIAAAVAAMEQFADSRKILAFVNSRKQVDASALHFKRRRFRDFPVFGHHGSLSKHSREQAEQRFKEQDRAICVATMTLEVGIDIGDIDLVVCLDPPFSLASFLQRIGRGCRRLQGKTRVLCVARDPGNELIFQALIRQATLGMPAGTRIPFRRSVLIQQILAYLQQVQRHQRTASQFQEVLRVGDTPPLVPTDLDAILNEMVALGMLDERSGVYRPATAGWDFIQSGKIYSNMAPSPVETAVVDADTGKTIASVAVVDRSHGGVRIAGKSYEVLSSGTSGKLLVRSGGEFRSSPKYHTSSLPYAFDIGACLANLLQIPSGRLVCLRLGDGLAVFTWLGKLLNTALAEGLRTAGMLVSAEAFYLLTSIDSPEGIISALQQAVGRIGVTNPFRSVAVENFADMGPYFDLFSPEMKMHARADWLDREFLQAWSQSLASIVIVQPDDDLGQKLLSLA